MNDKRIKIYEAPFTVRTSNVINKIYSNITNERIEFLDQLQEFTAEEIVSKRNIARISLREIRKVLASYGMALKGDILCDSEAEKKLIQDMPNQLKEMENILRDLQRRITHLSDHLDQLYCNMQPLK